MCRLPLGDLGIRGGKVEEQPLAPEVFGYATNGSAATERIKHDAAVGATGENAGLDQLAGEGCEVSVRSGIGGDGPDTALVALGRIPFRSFPMKTRMV